MCIVICFFHKISPFFRIFILSTDSIIPWFVSKNKCSFCFYAIHLPPVEEVLLYYVKKVYQTIQFRFIWNIITTHFHFPMRTHPSPLLIIWLFTITVSLQTMPESHLIQPESSHLHLQKLQATYWQFLLLQESDKSILR